jgi:hypothetical protein
MRGVPLVLLLVACEGKSEPFLANEASVADPSVKKEKPTAAPPASPEGGGTTEWVDGVSKSSPISGNPTLTVIERAFRNQQPAWPLLSNDGQTAVVALPTRNGPKGWLTFTVEYLGANREQPLQRIPLIDAKLMTTIHTALDTAAIAMADVKVLTKSAKRINERMREDGFTRFGGEIDKLAANRAGAFKLGRRDQVLTVSLRDWSAETPRLEAQQMPSAGDIDCVAEPVLRRLFFDDSRKRVLVHYGWETTADQCSLPDDRYYLLGP